ncbi:MAG: alpha/beta hydrolase [Eubacteriaceae bacterium]|jgi:pimeloyl-ACP methyl ester carboxylesterase|nr:alpha/beta hydrolase [Eubacteriaceae bacterium]
MTRIYGNKPYKIALVHGGPGAIGSLAAVAREISATHGAIEPLQSKMAVSELVEELYIQISEAANEPITVLGHSWGAWLSVLCAAKHPGIAKQLVLVGSGPFTAHYAYTIGQRRLANFTDEERAEYLNVLQLLDDGGEDEKTALLERLGELAEISDNYSLLEDDYKSQTVIDAEMYASVWREAEQMRSSGKLADALGNISCPAIIIHGSSDPHPIEGVAEPLKEYGIETSIYLLDKCGHSPFFEKHAKDEFYSILRTILL